MEPEANDRALIRELGRRRVFLFLAVFTAIFSLGAIGEESDALLSVLDEYAVLILMVAIVAFILVSWKKESLEQLRGQRNVIVVLVVVAIVFVAYAFLQENNDPADFRNEVPSPVWLIIMLANRFL